MRPRDREHAQRLEAELLAFDQKCHSLPGIRDAERRSVLIEQLLESVHRVEYVKVILTRDVSSQRADPNDSMFDPLRAAIHYMRLGNYEEAYWMVFLFVHFGRHRRGGWRYAREVYGKLGSGELWNWPAVSSNVTGFREWLGKNEQELRRPGSGFGNHRKYESLSGFALTGTGAAVDSYVTWIGSAGSHAELIGKAVRDAMGDPRYAFELLYSSMSVVRRFGRTGKFDYLTMVGKLGLAPIEPGSAYLVGSTGPLEGARLLFGLEERVRLEELLKQLGSCLRLGMQVLEDALCNWQKNPNQFERFRG